VEEGEEGCGGHPICTIECPRGVKGMWIRCIRNLAKKKERPVKGVLPFRSGGGEIPFRELQLLRQKQRLITVGL
jgi:hypothetical protein